MPFWRKESKQTPEEIDDELLGKVNLSLKKMPQFFQEISRFIILYSDNALTPNQYDEHRLFKQLKFLNDHCDQLQDMELAAQIREKYEAIVFSITRHRFSEITREVYRIKRELVYHQEITTGQQRSLANLHNELMQDSLQIHPWKTAMYTLHGFDDLIAEIRELAEVYILNK